MREIMYVQAVNEALREEMRRDPLVFLMGEDVELGAFGATAGLVEEFGKERIRNTPITESGFTGAAVGAAMAGMRPVAEIMFNNFAYVAMDQLCNQAAKLRYMSGGQAKMPITFRTMYGAIGAAAAQHSATLYAQFLNVPGLKIVVPSTPYDMKGLLKTAIRDDDPVIVFEHGRLGGVKGLVPEDDYLVPMGVADVKREGTDVTVVALGAMVYEALTVAEKLTGEGVSVEVVDPRTLIPLDKEAICASVKKTGRLVLADEGTKIGSAVGEIAAVVVEDGDSFGSLKAPIKRVCAPDVPIPFSPPLEKFVLPDADNIEAAVREVMKW
ncbi:MAG: alpha-ketoacid dehydrogenase subunit beta [Chloroflexota bacterium]|nr:alpha-ketoacid dehydrogenase subunit beta [Chloroflexota bacterium]